MKVLHLPTSVGGNAWALAQGEKELGLDSHVLVTADNWLHYQADKKLFNAMPQGITGKFKFLSTCFSEAYKIRNKYDVFHFNFGSTLVNNLGKGIINLDLPLYRGKIIVTYNGCDARQRYKAQKLDSIYACQNGNCNYESCINGRIDAFKDKSIRKFDKYADAIFSVNPDLFHFLPKRAKFLPYSLLPLNHDYVKKNYLNKEPLRIVHAPTNKESKGTKYIVSAVDEIKKKYGDDSINLILIENVKHEEAIKLYYQADIVIDQLLAGWYGAFAAEVMQMGIPVMAYIREKDLKFIPHNMQSDVQEAIINVNPHTIYDKLCEIIENRDMLVPFSEKSLEYVNEYHDFRKVARITKEAYEK